MFYKIFFIYFCPVRLKDFLNKYKVVNQAQLAKMMWSENNSANTKLANKLAENAGQRVTEKDLEDVRRVFTEICEQAKKITL